MPKCNVKILVQGDSFWATMELLLGGIRAAFLEPCQDYMGRYFQARIWKVCSRSSRFATWDGSATNRQCCFGQWLKEGLFSAVQKHVTDPYFQFLTSISFHGFVSFHAWRQLWKLSMHSSSDIKNSEPPSSTNTTSVSKRQPISTDSSYTVLLT